MKNNFYLLLLAMVVILSSSCEKEDPEIPNEEELITTVFYTLTPAGGGDDIVFSFKDLDGDGGEAPVIVGGNLSANSSYEGSISLLNETEDPAEDITEEIEEEREEHQFFYETSVEGLTILYSDEDEDGRPVGLTTDVNTNTAGTGTLTITLRHEPDKDAANVSMGDISNAGGETDIEITFPVVIN